MIHMAILGLIIVVGVRIGITDIMKSAYFAPLDNRVDWHTQHIFQEEIKARYSFGSAERSKRNYPRFTEEECTFEQAKIDDPRYYESAYRELEQERQGYVGAIKELQEDVQRGKQLRLHLRLESLVFPTVAIVRLDPNARVSARYLDNGVCRLRTDQEVDKVGFSMNLDPKDGWGFLLVRIVRALNNTQSRTGIRCNINQLQDPIREVGCFTAMTEYLVYGVLARRILPYTGREFGNIKDSLNWDFLIQAWKAADVIAQDEGLLWAVMTSFVQHQLPRLDDLGQGRLAGLLWVLWHKSHRNLAALATNTFLEARIPTSVEAWFMRRWADAGRQAPGMRQLWIYRYWLLRAGETFKVPQKLLTQWNQELKPAIGGATTLKLKGLYLKDLK